MKEDITQKILSIYGNFELNEVERLNELEILYMKQEEKLKRAKEVINGMIDNEEKYLLEINKLKSIIKEVREYIGSREHYEDDFDTEIEKVYKILDGVVDKE